MIYDIHTSRLYTGRELKFCLLKFAKYTYINIQKNLFAITNSSIDELKRIFFCMEIMLQEISFFWEMVFLPLLVCNLTKPEFEGAITLRGNIREPCRVV